MEKTQNKTPQSASDSSVPKAKIKRVPGFADEEKPSIAKSKRMPKGTELKKTDCQLTKPVYSRDADLQKN